MANRTGFAIFFLLILMNGVWAQKKAPLQNTTQEHTVLFDNNSYTLSAEEQLKLEKAIDMFRKMEGNSLYLEGHTNKLGSTASNYVLSGNRIAAVQSIVSTKLNNLAITTKNLGELQPRFSNDTEEGLAANRCVIIKLEKKSIKAEVIGKVVSKGKPMPKIKVYYKNEGVSDSLISDKNGQFKFMAEAQQQINVFTSEKNFFNNSQTISPEAGKANNVTLELTPFEVNAEINLTNILFYSNKNVVRKGVEDILKTMTNNFLVNENYCFEIQGHVNGQDQSPQFTQYYKELSEARAGTVYFYMKDQGVAKDRMIPVGYSNTKMLYPDNPDFEQLMQNMRVVIKLLPCEEVKQRRKSFNENQWLTTTKSRYFNDYQEADIKK